jgi:excisionase family DNA binding protein
VSGPWFDPRRQKLLTVAEYAQLTGSNERTVRRWIAKGALDVVHLGRSGAVRIVILCDDGGRLLLSGAVDNPDISAIPYHPANYPVDTVTPICEGRSSST